MDELQAEIRAAIDAGRYGLPLKRELGVVGRLVFNFVQGPKEAPLHWTALAVTLFILGFAAIANIAVPESVTFRSEPSGAELYLDGVKQGETPLKLTDLRGGAHTVELRKEGHETKIVRFQIQAFAPRSRFVEMERATPVSEVAMRERNTEPTVMAELFGRPKAAHGKK